MACQQRPVGRRALRQSRQPRHRHGWGAGFLISPPSERHGSRRQCTRRQPLGTLLAKLQARPLLITLDVLGGENVAPTTIGSLVNESLSASIPKSPPSGTLLVAFAFIYSKVQCWMMGSQWDGAMEISRNSAIRRISSGMSAFSEAK